jgi:hypothetical protein
MTKLLKAPLFLVAALSLSAFPTQNMAQTSLDGAWRLDRDRGGQELVFAGSLISGNTGCRPFSAEMTGQLERGRVRVGPLSASNNALRLPFWPNFEVSSLSPSETVGLKPATPRVFCSLQPRALHNAQILSCLPLLMALGIHASVTRAPVE